MESAESGKQFLPKNPNYLDEVGVDPSSIQVIVLVLSCQVPRIPSIQFKPDLFGSNQLHNRQVEKIITSAED